MLEHSGNIHLFSLVPATAAKQKHKGLMVIAAVMVCGVAGNVALWRKSRDLGTPAQPLTLPAEERAPTLPVREAPPAPSAPAPTIAPLPEGCHVEITVQEAGAQLVLDGNVAAGNQIKLDVPKDDKPHLVEATAPGFLPFKRTVNFSTDVFLTISLQKQRSSPPKRELTAGVKLDGRRADDQGMSPRSIGAKRPASKIDEDDPYAP
jgi:hypothetical protein